LNYTSDKVYRWWLEITKKGQTYIVGLLYHPPKPIYDIEELSCQYPHAVIYITACAVNQLDISKLCSDCGLTQTVQSVTHGRHTQDLFLTNREDTVSCTVVKSCLNTDHYALMVNCNKPISVSGLTDCDQTDRRQFQFYDIRQCYLDKLACAVNDCDWSCVIDAADIDIDEAYSLFLANIQRLIQYTIPCHKVTLTKTTPPHITTLVKSVKETQ